VQLSTGLAQAVKHGAIADAEYFAFLQTEGAAILAKDGPALDAWYSAPSRSRRRSRRRASGRRASGRLCTSGFLIDHAIEATSKFEVLHGEAVGIGMVYQAQLGETMGVTAKGTAERIVVLLEQYRLPVERPDGASVDQLIEVMRGDKKVRGGEIRFAVPKEIGGMRGEKKGAWTVAVEEKQIRESVGLRTGPIP